MPYTSGSVVIKISKPLGCGSNFGLRPFADSMLKLFSTAALLGAAFAQSSNSSSLPTVDLGYEIYRAATFNVC